MGYPLAEVLGGLLADAPQLARALGYANTTALLRKGYGLEFWCWVKGLDGALKRLVRPSPSQHPAIRKFWRLLRNPVPGAASGCPLLAPSTLRSRISRRRNQKSTQPPPTPAWAKRNQAQGIRLT